MVMLLTPLLIQGRPTKKDPASEVIRALDCRHPIAIKSGLVSEVCANATSQATGKEEEVFILQYSTESITKGYRCTRRVSSVYEICGAFSHTKVLMPPSILEPETITSQECQLIKERGTYQREDKTLIQVEVNKVARYKMVKHGELHVKTDDVECIGSTVWINGQEKKSVVELLSVEILIEEIKVALYDDKAVDLDREVKLVEACAVDFACNIGATAYIITPRPDKCPLYLVRQVKMEHIQVDTVEGKKAALISKQHKLFFMLKEAELTKNCYPTAEVYRTEYPEIKLALSTDPGRPAQNPQKAITASAVDPEMELKIVSEFLSWEQESLMNREVESVALEFCNRMKTTMLEQELSPFHADSLLRVRGDVLQEIYCTPVEAELRMGELRGKNCYAKAIPAYLDNEQVWVTTNEKLIVSHSGAGEIPCGLQPAPVFVTESGKLITADPELKIADLQLEHLGSPYMHPEGKILHELGDGELLYTAKEMSTYNQLVHFGRTRELVLDSLVAKYCSSGECGSYQPTGTSTFNLDHLATDITPWAQWWNNVRRELALIGNVCAVLVTVVWIVQICGALVQVLLQVCVRGTPLMTALKLVTGIGGAYQGPPPPGAPAAPIGWVQHLWPRAVQAVPPVPQAPPAEELPRREEEIPLMDVPRARQETDFAREASRPIPIERVGSLRRAPEIPTGARPAATPEDALTVELEAAGLHRDQARKCIEDYNRAQQQKYVEGYAPYMAHHREY